MITRKDDRITFNINRCVQCGACLSACSHDALIPNLIRDGLHSITWIEENCIRCELCIHTCPAGRLADIQLPSINDSFFIGLIHAKDKKVRHESSSGGAGRVLFKAALAQGLVETGYSLKIKNEYPWVEGAFWGKDVIYSLMPNSIYHPVLALQNFIKPSGVKSIVVIGCPCQLEAVSSMMKSKVNLIKIAIYCKQQKHLGFAQFVARTNGSRFDLKSKLTPVRWRGDGWPGTVCVDKVELPYEQVAAVPFGRHLWRVPGCKSCANPYGRDVDITLSDPWGIESHGAGKTLAIVWTEAGASLLERATSELSVQKISVEQALRAFNSSDENIKSRLAKYHSGEKHLPLGVRISGMLEDTQCHILEWILNRVVLPRFIMKVLAHLPDIRKVMNLAPK